MQRSANNISGLLVFTFIMTTLTGCDFPTKQKSSAEISSDDKSKTKMAAFTNRKSKLATIESQHIGSIVDSISHRGKITITALVIQDVQTHEKVKAVNIKITDFLNNDQEANSALDLDELDDLIKAINYMNDSLQRWKDTNSSFKRSASFRSRDDLTVAVMKQQDDFFLITAGEIIKASAALKTQTDIASLVKLIQTAKDYLETK